MKSVDRPEEGRLLFGRLPLLQPADLSAEQTRLYDRIQTDMVPWAEKAGFLAKLDDGRLIGPFNPILFSPAVGDAFLDLQTAEQHHTSLNERMRQIVILTVGAVWHCDYELYAHAAVARKACRSNTAIDDLSRGELPGEFGREDAPVQRLTWQLAGLHGIGPELYAEAQQIFDPKTMVDLIALAGIYSLICGRLNGFAIPVPVSVA